MNDIQKFMEQFLSTTNGQLILNGRIYHKSDCRLIAKGSKKLVYKIAGTNLCFFLPRKALYQSRGRLISPGKKALYQSWDRLIRAEKGDLDFIISLGLKAQHYEFLPIKIQAKGKVDSYSMNVLVAQDFQSLCEKESLVIHNPKAGYNKVQVTGKVPNMALIRQFLHDKSFAQNMLRQVVQDYVLASTYDLPINALRWLDYDSQQLCFEFQANKLPSVRYMFWDVVREFKASGCPWVPTLNDLRSGGDYRAGSIQGLKYLANEIARAMMDLSNKSRTGKMDGSYEALIQLQQELVAALDDEMLKQALAHARKIGLTSFNKILDILNERKGEINQKIVIDAMQVAITLESLDSVKRLLAICPSTFLSKLSKENMNELTALAAGYPNSAGIIDYLNTQWHSNSEEGQLISQFYKMYEPKLEADKGFFFRFFAVSHVNKDMSLKELVRHAQGLSGRGNGKRSQEVMRTMGWLDNDNKETSAISCYIL